MIIKRMLRDGITKVNNIGKCIYARRKIKEFAKTPNMQYIVCPYGIGDTVFLASLVQSYKIFNQVDKVCLIVKAGQKDIPDYFDSVDKKIVSNKVVESLRTYSISKRVFKQKNYQYGHFILDFSWPEPGQMLGINGSNLIDVYKRCVLRVPDYAGIEYPKVLVEKKVLKEYGKKYGDAKKTMVLFPYAQTLQCFPEEFWEKIAVYFKQHGYKVYTNVSSEKDEVIVGTMRLAMPIKELYVVSRMFQWECIALRSGICDLLLFSGIKMTVLYENSELLKAWSMHGLGVAAPNIKDVVVDFTKPLEDNLNLTIYSHTSISHSMVDRKKGREKKCR